MFPIAIVGALIAGGAVGGAIGAAIYEDHSDHSDHSDYSDYSSRPSYSDYSSRPSYSDSQYIRTKTEEKKHKKRNEDFINAKKSLQKAIQDSKSYLDNVCKEKNIKIDSSSILNLAIDVESKEFESAYCSIDKKIRNNISDAVNKSLAYKEMTIKEELEKVNEIILKINEKKFL